MRGPIPPNVRGMMGPQVRSPLPQAQLQPAPAPAKPSPRVARPAVVDLTREKPAAAGAKKNDFPCLSVQPRLVSIAWEVTSNPFLLHASEK